MLAPLVVLLSAGACTPSIVRPSVLTLTATGVELTGDRVTDRRWMGLAVALEGGLVICPASLLTLAGSARVTGRAGAPLPDHTMAVRMLDRARDLALLDLPAAAEATVALTPAAPSGPGPHEGVVVELAAWATPPTAVERPLSHNADGELLRLSESALPGSPYFDPQGRLYGFVGPDGGTVTRIESVVRRERSTALDAVFAATELTGVFAPALTRKTCLKPGEAFRMPVADASDVAIEVVPAEPGFLSSAFVRGPEVTWKGAVDGTTLLAFAGHRATSKGPVAGRHAAAMLLVNPARAAREACATLRIGTLAWERRLGAGGSADRGGDTVSGDLFEARSPSSSLGGTRPGSDATPGTGRRP